MATQILYKHIQFYEKSEKGSSRKESKSLLESFLLQPDIDLKDLTGMIVDILMASIDTVRLTK